MDRLIPISLRRDEDLMAVWVASRHAGRGRSDLFEELYRRHKKGVRGRIAAVLGPRHRSHLDDLDQDTWLEVARLEAWEPTSFKSFVLTVGTRKALTLLESHAVKRAAKVTEGQEADSPELLETRADDSSGPEDRVWAKRLIEVVVETVAAVLPERREAWMLHYVEGLSASEIADRTGWAVGTAKTRLRLANEALEEGLRTRGMDPDQIAADVAEVTA